MKRLLQISLLLSVATACEKAREPEAPVSEPGVAEALPPNPGAFDGALLQLTGVELVRGHRLRLVENGAVFDEIVRLVKGARQSIHLDLFIWRPSVPSDRIINAIAERTPHGVACRVVVDPLGSTASFTDEVKPRLEKAGCEVRLFRPMLEEPQVQKVVTRNHRKLVVVDGRVALTGGFGIFTSWLGDGVSGKDQWRDTNVTVEGPAVRDMQLTFAKDWMEAGGAMLPAHEVAAPGSVGKARAGFVTSSPDALGTEAERMTRLVISAAKKRLWISNAYFVPNEQILKLIEEQQRAGVDVRLLVAGPVHDWKVVLEAQRDSYERLIDSGVKIYEYQPSMMHAKTALVDEHLALVGSTNMDPLSLNRLEEGTLLVEDKAFAAQLERSFLKDLEHAKQIEKKDLPTIAPGQKASRAITRIIGKM